MTEAVLVSGLGVVSAAGATVAETLAGFAAGRRHVVRAASSLTPLDYPVFQVTAAVNDFLDGSRSLRLCGHALTEALADARLPHDLSRYRAGVCLGTTVASQLNDLRFYEDYRTTGHPDLRPVEAFLQGNPAEAVARRLGVTGPVSTIVNACSSSADAVGVALAWIRSGRCDLVIAGGTDELSRVPISGFGALGVYSREPCRPYDRDRQGLNLGEGAGILVLETAASAHRRGIAPTICVAGYGAACDAHHLTAPRPDGSGLETAIRSSLADAGIASSDIGFINAHGTATRDNDKVEGGALARIFGTCVPVLSTKGYTGHTLGAAGGLEAAFTALAVREGWIPASAGYAGRDEEIPLSAVVRERTAFSGRWALSTSLAFGGNNAALVVGRCV